MQTHKIVCDDDGVFYIDGISEYDYDLDGYDAFYDTPDGSVLIKVCDWDFEHKWVEIEFESEEIVVHLDHVHLLN